MGKQSTGKSYMLNHLFGTKFDISGGRCTDGSWLSVKIVEDILYVLCDFEGLGSFERSPQEDTLLATFNSAISSCTLFKCDNRFDRAVEQMFSSFQSGIKYMKDSEKCFEGELMLIIKDVVETGAKAAEADFKRHIVRLAKEAPWIENDDSKESLFFGEQMYSNLSTIPYPPLGTTSYFTELNETIEVAIDEIDILHEGGTDFLNFIKMVMAKLHIQDWSAMSGEQAKIRLNQIKAHLKNAVFGGATITPTNTEYTATFEVEDDQIDENLVTFDGCKVIHVNVKEIAKNHGDFNKLVKAFEASEFDDKINHNVGAQLIEMVENINDAGIILGKVESLQFLWKTFNIKFKRNHEKKNIDEFTHLYQLFLDLVYERRKIRVRSYIIDNTDKFEKDKSLTNDIDHLIQMSKNYFNDIDHTMKVCGWKCKSCYYSCLLAKNHEDYDDWPNDHHCRQKDHSCKEKCFYCLEEGVQRDCISECGHYAEHNCGAATHTCGKECPLIDFDGCGKKCTLECGHDEDEKNKTECKCSAAFHRCPEKCALYPQCKFNCRELHSAAKDHQHICAALQCPYTCKVQCWNSTLGKAVTCGRPCSGNHDHQLKMKKHECKDEDHTCDEEHFCPELCQLKGNCQVFVERIIEEKKQVFVTGAGSKIEYESYANANGKQLACCTKIPIGKMRHDGDVHICARNKSSHTCTEKCGSCNYFCDKKYGHGDEHDCAHGNMRNTIFYATEEVVNIGDGRTYKVRDQGVAEMCNLFCERLGRGHIHLEYCRTGENKDKCMPEEGIRHESKQYMPDPMVAKDEIKHGKFWSRRGWKDPCQESYLDKFELCDFVCQHPSHKEKEAKTNEEDETKFCTDMLWHKPCKTVTKHQFKCSHPFSNAHVIFVCDISGSMSSVDAGCSKAEYSFIRKAKKLDNRLGALYSAIYKFIDIRLQKGCSDLVSAVMTPARPEAYAAKRVKADKTFVQDYLLRFTPTGIENYGQAFGDTEKIINKSEQTVVIFLTDGESGDCGAATIVQALKSQMKKRLSLFCITLGPEQQFGAVKDDENDEEKKQQNFLRSREISFVPALKMKQRVEINNDINKDEFIETVQSVYGSHARVEMQSISNNNNKQQIQYQVVFNSKEQAQEAFSQNNFYEQQIASHLGISQSLLKFDKPCSPKSIDGMTLQLDSDSTSILCGACLIYDKNNKCLRVVSISNRDYNGIITHSGDTRVSGKSVHTVQLNLQSLTSNVKQLFFTLCACGGQDLSHFKRPIIALYANDEKNVNLIQYSIEQAANSRSVVMGRIFRNNNGWSIQALGTEEWGVPEKVCSHYDIAQTLIDTRLNSYRDNSTLKNICKVGGGEMLTALSGNELGTTFTAIAKQMNTGSFGKL
eukprot:228556_1